MLAGRQGRISLQLGRDQSGNLTKILTSESGSRGHRRALSERDQSSPTRVATTAMCPAGSGRARCAKPSAPRKTRGIRCAARTDRSKPRSVFAGSELHCAGSSRQARGLRLHWRRTIETIPFRKYWRRDVQAVSTRRGKLSFSNVFHYYMNHNGASKPEQSVSMRGFLCTTALMGLQLRWGAVDGRKRLTDADTERDVSRFPVTSSQTASAGTRRWDVTRPNPSLRSRKRGRFETGGTRSWGRCLFACGIPLRMLAVVDG